MTQLPTDLSLDMPQYVPTVQGRHRHTLVVQGAIVCLPSILMTAIRIALIG